METGIFPPEGYWLCEICRWREPFPTTVLNPNTSEASYKPKQRSYRKANLKKNVLAPDSPGAEMSSAETSSAETAVPNRRRRNVPDPILLGYEPNFHFIQGFLDASGRLGLDNDKTIITKSTIRFWKISDYNLVNGTSAKGKFANSISAWGQT